VDARNKSAHDNNGGEEDFQLDLERGRHVRRDRRIADQDAQGSISVIPVPSK